MNDSYKAAFEYLYHSENTKHLPIEPRLVARVAKLMVRQDALVAALDRYGNHSAGCNSYTVVPCPESEVRSGFKYGNCTCGLDEAIASVEGKT